MKATTFKKGSNWFAKVGRTVLNERFPNEEDAQKAADKEKARIEQKHAAAGVDDVLDGGASMHPRARPGSMINVY